MMPQTSETSEQIGRTKMRVRTNRLLIAVALAAAVVGLLWGQALTTWLNATLL